MKDLRNKQSDLLFRGRTIFSSDNTEERVGEMLSFVGAKANSELVQQACGYLSINNMQPTINNIETF